jgi:hypothetical protein
MNVNNEETMTQCTTLTLTGADVLTVTNIVGTDTMTYGSTTLVTFTATVKNNGSTPSVFNQKSISFYVGPTLTPSTLIHQVGLDVINPGATADITMTKNWSTWPVDAYSICAKTSDE